MQLFQLLFGKSKKKMRVIMIDSYKKCENYCFARQNVVGFHRIEQAPIGATVWKQKTCTIGSNKYEAGKNNGWIGKNGFNPREFFLYLATQEFISLILNFFSTDIYFEIVWQLFAISMCAFLAFKK